MPPDTRLRALVVDDEPLARRNLIVLLRRDPDIATVDECSSGAEAILQIRRSRPDLLFLDVQMPEYDGFDVLEILGAELPPVIVFVTAHDEHALRAFETGALDYLVKPFTDARFGRALDRAKQRFVAPRDGRANTAELLIVKNGGQVVFLKPADIDWIEAANYYACLHVGSEMHIIRRTLAALERELQSGPFCRIHRSTIVNLDRVRGLELTDDGEYAVIVKSGDRLRLSRRFRKSLQQRLGLRHE